LQETCKQLETDFLISAAVYEQFPQAPVKDMGEVNIRGKFDPMRVYAVTSAKFLRTQTAHKNIPLPRRPGLGIFLSLDKNKTV
jgi:class 3 adenylate cyclase